MINRIDTAVSTYERESEPLDVTVAACAVHDAERRSNESNEAA